MDYPALALLEFDGIASGLKTADAMLKKSPIAVLKCGTVHPGNYLVLIGGTVGSCQEAYQHGLNICTVVDSVFLPDIDKTVHGAALGNTMKPKHDALGILETSTSPAILHACDIAIKSAPVDICEIRYADDLGGKAFALFSGTLTDVEAALQYGSSVIANQLLRKELIPLIDENLSKLVASGTGFSSCKLSSPAGAEKVEL
jgi:microcompartment protein CcmL/EutN